MKKIELKKSDVVFIEDGHKYFLGLDELSGVTSILKSVLFPNKYAGIDDGVLSNAANRGTAIHEAIQNMELCRDQVYSAYMGDCEQCLICWNLQKPKDYTTIADEYLVSNNKDIASKIDLVQTDKDGNIILADIKTTTTYDAEYLSWQLSIYAWLFEMQNKGLKVGKLIAYWFKRTDGIWNMSTIEVERKSESDIEQLIEWWKNGEVHELTIVPDIQTEDTLPMPIVDLVTIYSDIDKQVEYYTKKRDEFRTRLLELMNEHNVEKIELNGGQMKVTKIPATTSSSFDSARFKEEHADMYSKYQKERKVKESIRITINNK